MMDSLADNRLPPEGVPPSRKQATRRTVNVRFLAGTLIALVILALAAYAWRAYQIRQTADMFLQRADTLEKEEDWRKAAGYLHRFLQLRPNDVDARIRLAQVYEHSANDLRSKARAIDLYYHALGMAPAAKQPPLRRHLAKLLLELQRFAPAESEARLLLKRDANDSQAKRLLALAVFGQFRSGASATTPETESSVVDVFKQALESNPGDVELSTILAGIYRDGSQPLRDSGQLLTNRQRGQLADKVMTEMVKANPRNPQAYVASYLYRTKHGLPRAEQDLELALKHGPNHLLALLLTADHARRKNPSGDQASTYYKRAIEVNPSDERAYLGLGDLYAAQGNVKAAIDAWRRGLKEANESSIQLNVRLVEGLIAERRLDEAERALNVLDGAVAQLSPSLPQTFRMSMHHLNDWLRARWLLRREDYSSAIPLLRRVAAADTTSDAEVDQSFRASLVLGDACGKVGQWDQAAQAYEHATVLRPKAALPRLMAATAWMAAHRPDIATQRYEQALELEDTPETWLLLAGAHYQRQTTSSDGKRDWEPFNKALAKAKDRAQQTRLPAAWRINLLEIDYLVASSEEKGKRAEALLRAKELLHQLENQHSDSAALLGQLVSMYERFGFTADADRAIAQLTAKSKNPVLPVLLHSKVLSSRKQYKQAREVLEKGLETLPPKVHTALRRRLVELSLEEGHIESSQAQLSRLLETDPTNVALVQQLAERAFELHNLKDAERWEKKLRELEGPDGSYWRYCRARRLLVQAEDTDDSRFIAACKLQSYLQSQRPAWPPVYVLAALISQRQGNLPQAISAYQEAIRLGDQRVSLCQQLVSLLYRTRRYAEAERYLSKVGDSAAASPALSWLEMQVFAKQGKLDQALQAARQGIARRPDDPTAQVWLGQILALRGQTNEADAAFRRAVEMAPTDSRAYNALFTFLVQSKQTDRARETLQTLVKNTELSDVQRATVLAQGYNLLGDRDKAEANYREAARLAPDDAETQMRLASFLLQSDTAAAEQALRRALEISPESGDARRTLAAVLAARGSESEWQEVERLLDRPDSDQNASSVDQRLQVTLLLRRGGKDNLRKARILLEKILANPEQTVDNDQLLLAQLYAAEGKPQLARQQYVSLISVPKPKVSHLILFIDMLLRDLPDKHVVQQQAARARKLDEIKSWLQRLADLAPDSWATASLRARWLHAQDQTSEIETLVEPVADSLLKKAETAKDQQQQKQQLFLTVGNLYLATEQYEAAERWYRRLHELDAKIYRPLAVSLARQDRLEEAIGLCVEAAKSDSSVQPAETVAFLLTSGHPTEKEFQICEPLLSQAVANHEDNAELLICVAGVRIVQSRVDEAAEIYRQVLKLKPDHLSTLNNLATLLSEMPGKRKEALQHIDQAIGIAGPKAGLLDTKGMILVLDGKPSDGLKYLRTAAADAHADPRYHFHLAVAYHRLGKTDEARLALQAARQGDLASRILTPMDQELLTQLEQEVFEQELH
ncbi:MAG: tetratricopeptide repeat protein [Pirellulales bacterium]|nr:tetratricopeptide repeat protein [Pirellulales bacterium]